MTNRVAIGNARGSVGMWVSAPGYDVMSCDPSWLTFDSTATTSQIYAKGTVAGTGGSLSYPSLGYVPAAFICYKDGQGNINTLLRGVNLQVTATGVNISNYNSGVTFQVLVWNTPGQ